MSPLPRKTQDDPAVMPAVSAPEDFDITIPPTLPTGPAAERWAHVAENTYEGRRDTAWFHTVATTTLVGMLLLWAGWQGTAPGDAIDTGIANLILHVGAWITGFLAVDASVDAWRLRREELAQFPTGRMRSEPNTIVPLGSVAVLAVIANTAMVLAALL